MNARPGFTQVPAEFEKRPVVDAQKRPRICISLGDHWLYRFCADWLTYRRLIRRAGGRPFTFQRRFWDGSVRSLPQDYDGLLLAGGEDIDPKHYSAHQFDPELRESQQPNVAGKSRSRDDLELLLIEQAEIAGRPILGICRGCQLLNVVHGGTLRALPPETRLHREVKYGCTHPVIIRRNSRVHQILGKRRLQYVRSLHRQVIDRCGEGLKIVARSPDGVPEAIEVAQPLSLHESDEFASDNNALAAIQANGVTWSRPCNDRWMIGVQWHPELIAWRNLDLDLVRAFVQAAAERQTRKSARPN